MATGTWIETSAENEEEEEVEEEEGAVKIGKSGRGKLLSSVGEAHRRRSEKKTVARRAKALKNKL
jgi:hypothetical protein